VEQLLKCQRWGVCDEGTADICRVALKTVHRFQQMAAHRAKLHHCQVVQEVDVQGVQMDEAHSKLRPKQVEWVHTALAMGSWFLLWVDFGPRTQEVAATLIAQVVAHVRTLPLFLTDGWKAYPAALLQVVGVVYRRRRRGNVGRKPKPCLVAPKDLFYAQVVKVRDKTAQVVAVSRRVVFGGPRRFGKQLRRRQLGETIQTGSVAKFDFWGKIQKLGIGNSTTYRLPNSRKSNFATEPAGVWAQTSGWPEPTTRGRAAARQWATSITHQSCASGGARVATRQ
jgi:hypothetical protein